MNKNCIECKKDISDSYYWPSRQNKSNQNVYYYCSDCLPKGLEQHKSWKAVWTKIINQGNMTTFDNSCPWCGIWFQEGTIDDAISDHYYHKHGSDKGDCGKSYHKNKEYVDSWKETNNEFAEQERKRWHCEESATNNESVNNSPNSISSNKISKNNNTNTNDMNNSSNANSKSNTTLYICLGIGAIALIGIIAYFLLKKNDRKQ